MKDRMINLLLKEPEGIIVACNILSCLNDGLMPKATIRKFLKACVKSYSEEPVNETSKLLIQFQDVARGERPLRSRSTVCYLFACATERDHIPAEEDFSTILSYWVFKRHLISAAASSAGHAFLPLAPDPTDPMLEDSIDKLNGRTDIFQAGAQLGGNHDRPFFWITRTKNLTGVRASVIDANIGDTVRDLLGLIHYADNVPLVEIQISADRVLRCNSARPTIAEACTHRRFKASLDASGTRLPGWGWTADLGRFAAGNTNIDGAEERVVSPTDFNANLNAKLKYAYRTNIARGTTPADDDRAFVEKICSGTSVTELQGKLLELLK